MINLSNVSFKYDKKMILKNINYEFKDQSFYSIIGPNGVGKSTLLKCMIKMNDLSSGNIFINNKNIENFTQKELARDISFIPQFFYSNYDYSVENIIEMGRFSYLNFLYKITKKDKLFVENIIERLALENIRHKPISKLSGGELQRTLIGRSLAQNSKIILLDESFSNLDLHHQLELAQLLKNLSIKEKKMIIMVTHNLNLAAEFSEYIILLKNGRIFVEGSPEKVLSQKKLSEVYDEKIRITNNPISKKPLLYFSSE